MGATFYGVGGNPEAAALAGIDVKKTLLFVFGSMGMMTALGGPAVRLSLANPLQTTAGAGFELDGNRVVLYRRRIHFWRIAR